MPKHAPKGKIKGTTLGGVLTVDPIRVSYPISQSCRATSKGSGKPCKYPVVPGAAVCRFHGGAAPQVKAKALERLMALQHPAIDALTKLIANVDTFPSTAYAAARDVLDRTEGKAIERQQQEVKAEVRIRWKD